MKSRPNTVDLHELELAAVIGRGPSREVALRLGLYETEGPVRRLVSLLTDEEVAGLVFRAGLPYTPSEALELKDHARELLVSYCLFWRDQDSVTESTDTKSPKNP